MAVHMAAVIEQRCAIGVVLAVLDLADEEQMVTLFVLAQVAAFKDSGAAVNQRHAMRRILVRRMRKAIRTLACKQLSQRLLRCCQHMDCVMRAVAEHRQGIGFQTQAPEHQRRRQRQRIEGADRRAHGMPLSTACRDDGDARGELPQRIAKFALRKRLGSTQDRGRQGGVHKTGAQNGRQARRAMGQEPQAIKPADMAELSA